jgi:hypothetical protein
MPGNPYWGIMWHRADGGYAYIVCTKNPPATIPAMYEHHKQPLASRATFYQRVLKNLVTALLIMLVSLAIGISGYHYTANIPWLDALHNASMILSGMGPVVQITTVSGKIFSSVYALFCGVVFITNVGIILAPAIHRIIHRLHLEEN